MWSIERLDQNRNFEQNDEALGRRRSHPPAVISDATDLRRSTRHSLSSRDKRCRCIARSESGGHFSSHAQVTRTRCGLSNG